MSPDPRQIAMDWHLDSMRSEDSVPWESYFTTLKVIRNATSKALGRRSREEPCRARMSLHVRFLKSSYPQYVDGHGRSRLLASPTQCSSHALSSEWKFHTTNACRFETDELQMQLVTVGRSSIFGVSRTEIEYARRHVPRFWARESGSVRSASQPRCAVIQSFTGPLNPRPL